MPLDSDAWDELIEDAAVKPQSVSGDAGSVSQRPLKDLIEARSAAQQSEAVAKPARGLRFTRLIPPGTS